MKLVIVESPTKARTISKFLGNGYIVKASMGHVMDLPKSTLGVDIENNFNPRYELSENKSATVLELKKLAKEADGVILATDPDREGEAIASHIQELLTIRHFGKPEQNGVAFRAPSKSKKSLVSIRNDGIFQRIVFHEITKDAIEEALKNPGKVNKNLVDAQTARRVLDRLVGYKLSPVLWQKIRRGLSAGRVQSVALRLIVEREREIGKFRKEVYYTVTVILEGAKRSVESHQVTKGSYYSPPAGGFLQDDKNGTSFDLVEISGEKIERQNIFKLYNGTYTVSKTIIESQEKADQILKDLKLKKFTVSGVLIKEAKRSPQPPFTTSTLQQQAAARLGFSGKRTMSLAQKLYEEGYITYHRTDSLNMSSSAIFKTREFIESEFGKKYVPINSRFYKTKQKLAQEAHEAIRPTGIGHKPTVISTQMGSAYGKLYELIWRRALASQMADALIESTTVIVDALPYCFKTTGSVLVFDGFLKITPFGLQDKKLPNFTALENLNLVSLLSEKHESAPPPRYNDASIIKSLEEEGIGRPSTYATIISTIEARNYIERDNNKFVPTSVGTTVNDFLVKNFSNIDDIPFTAAMEDQLDSVASGEKEWVPVIREFYNPFEKKLLDVKKAERVQIAAEETGELCPKDGAALVVRVGKFGKFISCKNFPACDFKKQFIMETQFNCPKCIPGGRQEGKILVKKTKKGRTFYGCSNYPACNFAVWKLSDLKKPL